MTLGKKHERKGKIPEHYQEKNMCGKYQREGKERKKIYVYVVRVICTIVEQKKERKGQYQTYMSHTITPPPSGKMIVPIIKSDSYINRGERERKKKKEIENDKNITVNKTLYSN